MLDFLTDSSICPSSTFRDTRTSDVAHEADQEDPKIGRENFGEDTLNGKVRVTSVSKGRQEQAHM